MKEKIVKLAQRLISIPSYVDNGINEKKIGDFVYQYLSGNCPWLEVQKQQVIGERFNVIVRDDYPTKLLICGHMDTVIPRSGWKFEPTRPFIKDNKLYGLGALDMKGSLAAVLTAIENFSLTKGLLALFYIDEEYNFTGMRKFISEYEAGDQLELILSADGGDLKIGYACRGLIDLDIEVVGKAGHAAWPDSGVNAVLAVTSAVRGLSKKLESDFTDSVLGSSVCNLAYIETDNKSRNVIPGKALVKLDVRPAKLNLKGKKVAEILKNELTKQGAKLGSYKVLNDLGPRMTKRQDLQRFKSIVERIIGGEVDFVEAKDCGYGDSAMLYEKYKVPTASFGPRPNKMAHQANEHVLINDLEKCVRVFTEAIKYYCT